MTGPDTRITVNLRPRITLDLPPGDWFACEHPERPYEPGIRWHLDPTFCRACHVRYQVDRLHMPDHYRPILDEAMGALA